MKRTIEDLIKKFYNRELSAVDVLDSIDEVFFEGKISEENKTKAIIEDIKLSCDEILPSSDVPLVGKVEGHVDLYWVNICLKTIEELLFLHNEIKDALTKIAKKHNIIINPVYRVDQEYYE